jgi:hypothetical protein
VSDDSIEWHPRAAPIARRQSAPPAAGLHAADAQPSSRAHHAPPPSNTAAHASTAHASSAHASAAHAPGGVGASGASAPGVGAPGVSAAAASMAASMAQLFPHFTSLQSLKARGETTHVDYFGQCGLEGDGGSRPPRPTGGGGCCGGAAGGAPPKRVAGRAAKAGRKREAAPRNEWRTQGGQRIYYDADGKKSTGSDAFRKHAKHQVATKGASSSVTVPESAQDVAAAQAERLRAGAERMAARRGH